MNNNPKQPRPKDSTKKIVSLTINPALIARLDEYAAERKLSRSAAIETAITGLFALNFNVPLAAAENSVVLPNDCIFASPSLGAAVFY
jgi:hypothetical protein